ncbi:hypothetical protein BH23BAC4_BH23BAC4_07590 [soil metagenome]
MRGDVVGLKYRLAALLDDFPALECRLAALKYRFAVFE